MFFDVSIPASLRFIIFSFISFGIELNEIFIDIDIYVCADYIHHQIKLIATLSNNKVSKDILNGMVHLIMRSLKKS